MVPVSGTKAGAGMQKIKAGVVGVGQMGHYHVGVYSELFNL
jgi:hypothetical protein